MPHQLLGVMCKVETVTVNIFMEDQSSHCFFNRIESIRGHWTLFHKVIVSYITRGYIRICNVLLWVLVKKV